METELTSEVVERRGWVAVVVVGGVTREVVVVVGVVVVGGITPATGLRSRNRWIPRPIVRPDHLLLRA